MERSLDNVERGVVETIDFERLQKRLLSGEQLTIKLGIDPTAPGIHLGHAVQFMKLRDFQELGHHIVFIVGDFTAEIGDTSDKDSERPMLTTREVKQNLKVYKQQAGRILDMRKVKVYYNSKWLKKLGFREIGEQATLFSVADFISRTNIRRRLDGGKRISLRELLYPMMQGYDSVMVRSDVEIGGIEQKFNLLAGRTMQEHYGQIPQAILMMDLLMGTDGEKMSKSKGNAINLSDTAEDMYGGIMSVSDNELRQYFIHLTRVPLGEVDAILSGAHPREAKMRLAREIVSIIYDSGQALAAEENFVRVFQNKSMPADIRELPVSKAKIVDVLIETSLATSKSDAKRLLIQGGVKVNEAVVSDEDYIVAKGSVIQKGKRHFIRVI